eukprot:scaffold6781_cov204-Amphora_coffeaeformis.AAC.10
MPSCRCIARGCHETTRETQVQIILIFTHNGGSLPCLGFVLLYPQGLGEHPLGRQGSMAVSVDGKGRVTPTRGENFACLCGSPLIHPQQTGTKGIAGLVQRHHGTTRGIQTNGSNIIMFQQGCFLYRMNGISDGLTQSTVPIGRFLFGPSGPWMRGFVRHGTGFSHHVARFGVETTCPNRFRATIDTNDQLRDAAIVTLII